MFPTRIDLSEETRSRVCDLLNQQLADVFDLYSQTKQAHWNVKGRDFIQLHKLFDELATVLQGPIDEIAERITTLGGVAKGTVRMAASNSKLPDYPLDATEGMHHVRLLSDRWAVFARSIRAAIDTSDEWGDKATSDLCTEITREIDKGLWFLEAHLIATACDTKSDSTRVG
jgi:starvation-inducible DNA-binding protein